MTWLDEVKWDENGLVPVIAQEEGTGDVLMFAWMNREALARTAETGEAVYWSRSRKRLWHKGEESGHIQKITKIFYDCDNDTLLIQVEQVGGIACHTGKKSCFFNEITGLPLKEVRIERLSRHLYDIYQLSKTEIKQKALNDNELYETIVNHRHNFTRISKVDYNKHQPQTINPIPPTEVIKEWEADYNTMLTEMIYDEAPTFQKLIDEIAQLKTEINNLNWKMKSEFPLPKS